MQSTQDIFTYRKYWAKRFGTASVLPMSRDEMDILGWDSCDIIIVSGDAYVDHPSFGMALIGRLLESQGFRTMPIRRVMRVAGVRIVRSLSMRNVHVKLLRVCR